MGDYDRFANYGTDADGYRLTAFARGFLCLAAAEANAKGGTLTVFAEELLEMATEADLADIEVRLGAEPGSLTNEGE